MRDKGRRERERDGESRDGEGITLSLSVQISQYRSVLRKEVIFFDVDE